MLKKNYEFQFVFRKGKRFSSTHFTIIVAPCKRKCAKFGIVISKKIGKAVVRNKKRRQIKEIIRPIIKTFIPNQYVIVAKENIVEVDFNILKVEIVSFFAKNKFLISNEHNTKNINSTD